MQNNDMDIHSIIIAGDLFPSENNISLFIEGKSNELFGEKVCELFQRADFSIANLEGALTNVSTPQPKDGPSIKAPKETIAGIKNLGLSAVALANNHITDYLLQGCKDTIEVLDKAGIKHIGLVSLEECEDLSKNKYISIPVGNQKVCIYNVSETFFCSPTHDSLGANTYDEWIVCNELIKLKETHDFIVVLYHGGAEYLPYPTPQTRKRFHRMADCGADFIVSQHTHCIGCEEWYNNSYLLYGQGNFLFARQKKFPHLTKQGLVTEIVFTKDEFSVINHLVNIENDVLRYDAEQNLSTFKERSSHVDDDEFIINEYQKLKIGEIMQRYLRAAKGNYPLQRISNFFFSSYSRNIGQSYDRQQILKNIGVLQDDRRREDMYYVWKYLLDNNI